MIALHSMLPYVFNAQHLKASLFHPTIFALSSCPSLLPLSTAYPSCPSLLPHAPAPVSSLSLLSLPTCPSHLPLSPAPPNCSSPLPTLTARDLSATSQEHSLTLKKLMREHQVEVQGMEYASQLKKKELEVCT